MNRIKNSLKKNGVYLAAFLIPLLLFLVRAYVNDSWPAGEGSILRGDAAAQYTPLYYQLWDKVHNGESLFYGWNAAGGYDFFLNMAYFISSPFSLLVLLFPRDFIPVSVQIIILLKWACIAVAMTYYFKNSRYNTLQKNKNIVSLFLGMGFALSTGILNYLAWLNWLDVLILLPFLLLEIEQIQDGISWKRYYLLLSFCMLSNFYFSYHVGVFLLIWVILQFLESGNTRWFTDVLKFCFYSALSVLTGMVVILPCVIASGLRDSDISEGIGRDYALRILNSFTDVLKNMNALDDIPLSNSMEPNIYCSVAAVSLILFFCFVGIKKREKYYILGVWLLMTLSLMFGALSLFWHGFSVPHGAYNRFVDIYIFLMLFMALQVLLHLREVKIKQVALMAFVWIFLFGVTFFAIKQYLDFYVYLITVMFFTIYMLLMFFYKKDRLRYDSLVISISLIGMVELLMTAYNAFSVYDCSQFSSEDYGTKQAYELTKDVELEPGERVAYSIYYANMGMVTDKATDSGYLSYSNGQYLSYNYHLGAITDPQVSSGYSGGTPLMNLLYNTRYGFVMNESKWMFSDAKTVAEYKGMSLVRMNRLAGLGYMVNKEITSWTTKSDNMIGIQNDFVKAATGEEDILTLITPDVTAIKELDKSTLEPRITENGDIYYKMEMQYGGAYDAVTLNYVVEEDMEAYLALKKDALLSTYVYIDDQPTYYSPRYGNDEMIYIGSVKKGQRVKIILAPYSTVRVGTEITIQCQFAKFDENVYSKVYDKLSENVYQIETMEDAYVKGNIHAKEDGIMMTSIQAQKGFKVYVDGEYVDYKTIGETMIGVPLEAGDHVVEFCYRTPYVILGMILSVAGVLIFVGFEWRCSRKKEI